MANKEYLGDGVYASLESDRNELTLTTENGIEVTNRIVLDAYVLQALDSFIERYMI